MKKLFQLFIFCFIELSVHAQCDLTKRPIVFIHGFLASGDTYARQIQRFIERMYCPERLFVFDWNSIGSDGKKNDSLLADFIDKVLKKTGASQIDLVGHSAGGGLARGYLIDSIHAQKVAHYIHLGSRKWYYEFSWFPNQKCLNIYSSADMVMGNMDGDVDGAVNLDLKDKDHYETATSMETFRSMYNFLNEGKDETDKNAIFLISEISGKAVLLGDNMPMVNAKVNVYRLNEKSGTRISKKPNQTFMTGPGGEWGTFVANRKYTYEIELVPADKAGRTISYYFEPHNKPDKYIYLRGFPKENMVGMMLSGLPGKYDQSVIVVYSATKAMIAGRDSVTINGVPVSSPALTPAGKTIISSFIFDDGDGKTSGKGLKQFSAAPFIGGVDIYLPANKKTVNTIYYNGRKMVLPARPSKERIMLAVFN